MKTLIQRTAFVLGSAAILLAAMACSSEKQAATPAPETVRDLQVVTVQSSTLPSYYEAVGTVRPAQSAQLSAQVIGNIVRLNVREGDRVGQGQVLAIIDDSQTRAAVDRATAGRTASQQEIAAADADFALAESTLKRYQDLFDKKSVSPHEFDEVKTRYEATKARRDMARAGSAGADAALAQARNAQGFTQVRAPFAGVVTAKLADTGMLAAPGTPIFTVEDSSTFRLEATVDERGIAAVHLGESVPVIIDAPGKSLTGKVVQILPAADASSRSFIVKVELPKDAAVRSGLFGRARFPLGTRQALAIPQTAIVKRGTMQGVYVLGADQVASLRYVSLGSPADANVEVLSGIDSGERIVSAPGQRELNGKKIEVR